MKSTLSTAQRTILDRLSNGEVVYQRWDSGACYFAVEQQAFGGAANKASVDSLNDKGLIAQDNYGWRYRNNSSWIVLEITDAGRTALKERQDNDQASLHPILPR